MNHWYDILYEESLHMPVVNTHCHHLPDSYFSSTVTLNALLGSSYLSQEWCRMPYQDKAQRSAFLDALRFNSYFIYFSRALQALYAPGVPLTEDTWDEYSARIAAAHQADPERHLHLLQEVCGYESIVLDGFWAPGTDNGHPHLFHPTYRIDMYLYGYAPEVRCPNGYNPTLLYDWPCGDIDEYLRMMRATVTQRVAEGCCALKAAIPYHRGLDYRPVTKSEANAVFVKKDKADSRDVKNFQDYVFYALCDIAADLNLPFQCHTGLGLLRRSSALELLDVLEAKPRTKFILFHGNYPWTDDLMALVHNLPNVYPDICWLPLLAPRAGAAALHGLIEVGRQDRICWGCDTWTGEESLGALLAARHCLSLVLSEKVEDGYFSLSDARLLLGNILFHNARALYERRK